jgi:GNAT superfamily N-acetyltransferase
MVTIEKADPLSPESQRLIERLSTELAEITGDNGKSNFTTDDMRSDKALWVLARETSGEATGCGALRPLSDNIAEIKRMFSTRKTPGVGTLLLNFLEMSARHLGYAEIRLETRLINHRAVAFYQKNGYQQIENYGPYIGRAEAICFSKCLI